MQLELLLVMIWLPLDTILQISECHLLLVLVHGKSLAIILLDKVVHLGVLATCSNLHIGSRASALTPKSVLFNHFNVLFC